MSCPNKNHPDWKALVNEIGEIAAMQAFMDNGNQIPNVDGSKKSKRTRVTIEQMFDNIGRYFESKSTLDSLEKHPEVARQMIDELQERFPWVQVNKDGLFDAEGNWLEIPSNKQGRHYRNAFMSAVAWSNDSAMETPPHEYAHEYIEMYKNSPLVQQGIKKYGEERLVTLIGRKYAGAKMSTSFEKFLADFWKMVRATFGTPSVVDILTDSFAKNEKLAEPYMSETAVHNFQDNAEPKYKRSSISGFSDSLSRSTNQNVTQSRDYALEQIQNVIKEDTDTQSAAATIGQWWAEQVSKAHNLTKDAKGDISNYAGMSQSTIDTVNNILSNKENNSKENIANALKGDDVALSTEEQFALNTMLNLLRAIDKKIEIQNSYLDGDKLVNKNSVNNIIDEEITKTNIQRKKNQDSQNKYIRDLSKALNKGLKYITNSRLWAKYLSGGENTMFSTMVYKGLNEAREDFARFRQDFDDMFKSDKLKSLYDGSEFHNPKANIKELETKTFKLDSNLNKKTLKEFDGDEIVLTKAEMIAIYLTDRQLDKKEDLRSGIKLEYIDGRNYDLGLDYILTEEQILEITSEMESDPSVSELVSSIDKATQYSYDNTNPQFMKLNGYSLDNFENYFPVSHGSQSLKMSKKKNVIEDMRSMRLRTPGAGPIRLVDPFKVLANMKMANASYSAYAIPIHNAQKTIDSVQGKFYSKDELDYIKSLQGTIDKIQDSGSLYSSHAENKVSRFFNKMQGNFAVALLSKNLGVVFKQQVSLETATNEIDRKFIRKAGANLGPVNFINPFKLLKALGAGDETMMPIEWQQAEKSKEYDTLIKYPLFRERFEGTISKESGEAIMGKEIAEDKVKLPFVKKDGKPIYVTKQRLMKSITIMDTLTIIRLYKAVQYETESRMNEPKFRNMTDEQIEQHNVNRLQEIVDKTQPTFDQLNRTGLSQSNNPIARSLTMFSSATSKMGMGMTEALIDYLHNPTAEARAKFMKRMISTGVNTSIMLTTIDLMRYALLNGWTEDDDDELFEKYAISSLTSTVGSIQGVGGVMGIIISQMDSNPWYKTMQDPTQHIVQEGAEGVANLLKGNVGKAMKQGVGTYSKVAGLPFSIYSNTEKIIKRVAVE